MTTKVGQVECVKALLLVADAKLQYSRALREAAVRCDVKCMKILYAHSDPHIALEVLHIRAPNSTDSHALLEQMIVQKQHGALLEATREHGVSWQPRKNVMVLHPSPQQMTKAPLFDIIKYIFHGFEQWTSKTTLNFYSKPQKTETSLRSTA